jgi:hypothetical protein
MKILARFAVLALLAVGMAACKKDPAPTPVPKTAAAAPAAG